jgi:hypothetical protein
LALIALVSLSAYSHSAFAGFRCQMAPPALNWVAQYRVVLMVTACKAM